MFPILSSSQGALLVDEWSDLSLHPLELGGEQCSFVLRSQYLEEITEIIQLSALHTRKQRSKEMPCLDKDHTSGWFSVKK